MRIISLVTCLLILLTACRQKPQDTIVGKWEQVPKTGPFTRVSVSGPGVMTFDFKSNGTLITQGGVQAVATTVDGTVVKQGGSSAVKHRYSFVDDHTITISLSEGVLFKGQEVTMKVTVSRNRMTLTETAPSGLEFVKNGTVTLQRVR
ncbi:MAG: hypothetical protein JSW47_07815 [Phycisphaerales bacterium]|nr:MAG: hypothetical protein JSW47_07815 [Phycisphaerales bacterium]